MALRRIRSALGWLGLWGPWPLFVVGSSAGFALGFQLGAAELALFAVPAVAVTLLVALEALAPARAGQGAWRDPALWRDVGHQVIGQVFGNQLGELLFLGAAALVAGRLSAYLGMELWPSHWPLAVQGLLLVFLADGLEYGRHRLTHTVSWLWPIHALHHSVDRMHVLKSGRGHFLDMVFRNLAVFAPLVALGVPGEVLLWYPAAVTALGPIGHSNVALRVPGFLHRVLMTPQVHWIHHERELRLSLSNYANVFPLWDLLFGSYRHPEGRESTDFGIEGDPMPADFAGQLLSPFTLRAAPNP
jgi:sterol desaturase/sphingolipid hydroxylase (fatty acid hydroxylase superfamily)